MRNSKKFVSILAGIMALILLLSLIASVIPSLVHAADELSSSEIEKQIEELEKEKAEIDKQIDAYEDKLSENLDEMTQIVEQKNLIDQEIFMLYEQIGNIEQQVAAYGVLIADKQDQLDAAEARFEELSLRNKDRIRAMEEEGELSYWSVLFQANSFSDLLDRLNMVEEIAASDQRRLQELHDAADQVALAREELAEERAALEETKAELDATQALLDERKAEADALLQELLARADELEDLQAELEQQESDFLDQIALKEQEYDEAKLAEWLAYMATYTTVPPATTAPPAGEQGNTNNSTGTNQGTGAAGNGGTTTAPTPGSTSWIRPCSYVMMTSPFGNRVSPTSGASTYHQGVDLAGPEGTPIYAARSGIVTVAGWGNAAGYYVTINHLDGFSSIYMHLSSYVVSSGMSVSQGQLIGYMGNTGVSTGSHLHFGIAYNGAYVNPAGYVNLY